MKTLEEYFAISIEDGIIDHSIRATKSKDGVLTFYIHPTSFDGKTLDFEVKGNELSLLHGENHIPDKEEQSYDDSKVTQSSSPILKYFKYDHLPPQLQQISGPTGDLAGMMDGWLPSCAEKSAGLRKLLEAKDCFVRAALDK